MLPRKMFFPIGGGAELEERIHGALLVSKYFNSHLEMLVAEHDIKNAIPNLVAIPDDILQRIESLQHDGSKEDRSVFEKSCKELGVVITPSPGPISIESKGKNKASDPFPTEIAYLVLQ